MTIAGKPWPRQEAHTQAHQRATLRSSKQEDNDRRRDLHGAETTMSILASARSAPAKHIIRGDQEQAVIKTAASSNDGGVETRRTAPAEKGTPAAWGRRPKTVKRVTAQRWTGGAPCRRQKNGQPISLSSTASE
ncbi:hypothetical protein PAHAL_3G507600 [Panicum hallii]|uniref:Uncharacterized protein n=1 Tax=Panicum hallii TaxID=206008 RepID=A0A2S3HFZ5_9POAL|nr:hypothetical protein PAHAL_3G507600 [Panicum hallii]